MADVGADDWRELSALVADVFGDDDAGLWAVRAAPFAHAACAPLAEDAAAVVSCGVHPAEAEALFACDTTECAAFVALVAEMSNVDDFRAPLLESAGWSLAVEPPFDSLSPHTICERARGCAASADLMVVESDEDRAHAGDGAPPPTEAARVVAMVPAPRPEPRKRRRSVRLNPAVVCGAA